MAPRTHRNALQPGFEILWYRIESILGQGGFGITYLATDTKLDLPVAIKEYMPMELASREGDSSVAPVTDDREEAFEWGRTRFLDEAKTLAKFKHPNTVRVLFYTEANNTGYMVMEYEAGQALDARLRRDDPFDQQTLLQTFLPLLDGLSVVHAAGFIHRDIKPANIFIREDGSPVLLDFGAARQAIAGHTRTLTAVVSPGYAPFEQYAASGVKQGPWTDIYAMGATMYHVVVGRAPPDAITRSSIMHEEPDPMPPVVEAGGERFSRATLEAIDRALSFRERDRPQTVLEWRDMLTGTKPAFDLSEPPTEVNVAPPSTQTSRWWMVVVVLLTVLLAGGSFYYTAYLMPRDESGEPPGPSSTTPDVAQISPPAHGSLEDSLTTSDTTKAQPIQDPPPLEVESDIALVAGAETVDPEPVNPEPVDPEPVDPEPVVDDATAALEARRKLAEAAAEEAARQQDVLVQDLLKEAEKDFEAGRFVGARERYAVVLSLEPTNTAALGGYEGLLMHYLQLADEALSEQRFALARQQLGNAHILGVHPDRVEAVRKEVDVAEAERKAVQENRRQSAEAESKLQAELERQRQEKAAREQAELAARTEKAESLLVEAEDHLSALRLTSPVGSNAFEAFISVLELAPDNGKAVAGLEEIAKRYRGLAGAAAGDGDYDKALAYLTRAIDRFETGIPATISTDAVSSVDKTVAGLRAFRNDVQTAAREADRVAAETERRAREERERRRAAEEAARLAALIKQRADLERQQEALQQAQREALAQEQVLAAKRSRYNVAIAAAQRAEDSFDRDAAISRYSEAVSIFPDDPVANNGLSRVSDRWFGTCGAITGNWHYSTGGLVTLNADGSAKHDLVVVFNALGTWECLNPARREIRITWNTGFTDRLTVMPGARRLEGKNNLGLPVWGDRE